MKTPLSLKIAGFLFCLVVIVGIFCLWLQDHYTVPILTYHNVGPLSSSFAHMNTVSQKAFEYQMAFIRKNGYNAISFEQLLEGMANKQKFPHNTVVVQFDDGYKNNFTQAFPILKKYHIPAVVFLISDKIGQDDYFLTWSQVKEMEASGFIAGAHTRLHKYLPELSRQEAQEEIAGSKRIIEEHLGHPIYYFSYPSGGFTQETKELTKAAGYKAAVTTNRGKDRLNRDVFELNRIRLNEKDNRYGGFLLRAKLSGYYNLFRETKPDSTLKDY